jgi:hypothetical protein
MTVSLAQLLVRATKAQFYETAINVAQTLGLPVTTWQPGDPTRSLYHVEAEFLDQLEGLAHDFVQSGFLDSAVGNWLKLLAKEVFNIEIPPATFAATDVVLTNDGAGHFEIEAGDLVLKNTSTGKIYRNTTGGVLLSGTGNTLTVAVEAEEAGSESSAGVGQIDDLVTALIDVTCSNPLPAVGIDEQDKQTTIDQCRAKLSTLSPNGTKDAYAFVARNFELSGTSVVSRVRTYSNSTNGQVRVYLASAAGGITAPDVALVDAAIQKWATPIAITSIVASATPVVVPITYTINVYRRVNKTVQTVKDDIAANLATMFSARPIGGDIAPPLTGRIYQSMIESVIRGTHAQDTFSVNLSAPSADVGLAEHEVATLGTIAAVVNLVNDP